MRLRNLGIAVGLLWAVGATRGDTATQPAKVDLVGVVRYSVLGGNYTLSVEQAVYQLVGKGLGGFDGKRAHVTGTRVDTSQGDMAAHQVVVNVETIEAAKE